MRAYRPVLTHRTARALFVSAAVSGLGDWVGLAALVILAYDRSGSAVGTGLLFAVQGAAAVLGTGVLSGQLDRCDRGAALRVVYLAGGGSLLLPLAVGGVWPVLVASAVIGLVRPVAASLRHALAGAELPTELLGPVVALQKATGDATAALGLATGGALTLWLGAGVSLSLDAATFVLAALLTLSVPASRGAGDGARSPLAGYSVWWSEPRLRSFVLLLAGLALVSSLPETLAPAAAEGSAWLPVVLAAQAAGTTAAGVVLGHRQHLESIRTLLLGTAATGLTLLLGASVAGLPPVFLALANLFLGLALGVTVLAQTAFTRAAPRDRLGAAVSSAITVVMLAEGLGALAVGWWSEQFGVGSAYLAAAVPTLLAGLLLLGRGGRTAQPAVAAATLAGTPSQRLPCDPVDSQVAPSRSVLTEGHVLEPAGDQDEPQRRLP